MIYLRSFKLSGETVNDPYIYPYSVFKHKENSILVFQPITVLYGNNASGKSTLLNVIANKLEIKGKEYATNNQFGIIPYFLNYVGECSYSLGEQENGRSFCKLPKASRYIKSEDILYEIKKVEQETALRESYIFDQLQKGHTIQELEQGKLAKEMAKQMSFITFSQEKSSNGEATLQLLLDALEPDTLYLLDEPEVSLSPQNQVELARQLNEKARLLGCQFIIATHSPFLLGTLQAKIYNLDLKELETSHWYELENIKYFYQFFKERESLFQ